jgi:predicted DNA-binding ribbon-helix-helix protein
LAFKAQADASARGIKKTGEICNPARSQGNEPAVKDLTCLKKSQPAFAIFSDGRAIMLAQRGIDPMQSSSVHREPATEMKSAIVKRSVELNGHKTSVSLEDEFWNGLRQIAETQKTPLPNLLQSIDSGRGVANLSSAIRVFVLSHYRAQAAAHGAGRVMPQDVPSHLTPTSVRTSNPSS